jgi:hypothetical protein
MDVVFSFESSGGKAFRDGRERPQWVESRLSGTAGHVPLMS